MKAQVFNRNFVLLLIGQAASMFATVLLKFTVSLVILDLTGSAAVFGMITSISCLPPVFLSPLAGVLADRKNKRNLMVAMDGMYCIMAILLAVSMSIHNKLFIITVIMFLLSIISSFEAPVVQASVPLIQSKEKLVKSNAAVNQVSMITNLIGPLLAGVCYGIAGKNNLTRVQVIFLACALCFFLAAYVETFIKIPNVNIRETIGLQTAMQDFKDGIHYLLTGHKYVFQAILLIAAFVFLIQPLLIVGSPFIVRIVLQLNPAFNGLLQASMGAAGVLGGIMAGVISDRFKIYRIYQLFLIMGVSTAVFGIAILLNISPIITYIIFVMIGIVIYVLAVMAGIYVISAIQQNISDGMLGRIMSFYSSITNAALTMGILLYGYLYEKYSEQLSVIMFVTALLIVGISCMGKRIYRHL